jgi:hypothetical protein
MRVQSVSIGLLVQYNGALVCVCAEASPTDRYMQLVTLSRIEHVCLSDRRAKSKCFLYTPTTTTTTASARVSCSAFTSRFAVIQVSR